MKVLQYIRQLGPNASLDRKTLTMKVTMLMSLVSAARGQELKVLQLDNMFPERDKVTFRIVNRTKTGLNRIVFHKYDTYENLDVVTCLEAYVIATQALRDTTEKKQQLLISFKSPHNPVQTCTIARWLRETMEEAGIDTSHYKAHSVRSAATSKAREKGLSTNQIMKAANWSNANTFQRYYNKDIEFDNSGKFSEMVLS